MGPTPQLFRNSFTGVGVTGILGLTAPAFTTIPSTMLNFSTVQVNFPLQAWFTGNIVSPSGAAGGSGGVTLSNFDIRFNIDNNPGSFITSTVPTSPIVIGIDLQHAVIGSAGVHTLWLEWRRTQGGRIVAIQNGTVNILGW
jgi:hypothetical protein